MLQFPIPYTPISHTLHFLLYIFYLLIKLFNKNKNKTVMQKGYRLLGAEVLLTTRGACSPAVQQFDEYHMHSRYK